MKEFELRDRLTELERETRILRDQLSRLPTRPAAIPPGARVLLGQTVGAVAAVDATFSVNNLENVRPGPLPSGSLTVQNRLGLEFSGAGKWVLLIQNIAGEWIAWGRSNETGGGGGGTANLVRFALTAELTLAGTSAAAVIDGTATAITVTDPDARFAGLSGYKGVAYETGTLTYEIITMEGLARFGDFTAEAASDDTYETITATLDHLWGNPARGMSPAGTTGISVYKLLVDTGTYIPIQNGDKFRAIWDEVEQKWKLFWYPGLRITVRGTTTSTVSPGDSTFTLTDISLVNGLVEPAGNITVANQPAGRYGNGETVYARFNLTVSSDPATSWDAADMRNFIPILKGRPAYNASNVQVLGHEIDTDDDEIKWLDGEVCNPSS